MLSPTAKVKRDGQPMVVEADTLVPGDIVLLKSGDKVPADVRLITATNLQARGRWLFGDGGKENGPATVCMCCDCLGALPLALHTHACPLAGRPA